MRIRLIEYNFQKNSGITFFYPSQKIISNSNRDYSKRITLLQSQKKYY